MDHIGSSYISWPDLIISGVAIFLFHRLTTLPPNSSFCRVLAVLTGCVIAAIIVVIIVADNLSQNGVHELAMVGFGLAFGLFQWNDDRVKRKLAPVARTESSR